MITVKEIENRIAEMCSHFTFEYNGISCGIDPLCNSDKNIKFDIWCGEDVFTAKTVEEVMSKPFFNGKSLAEIAEKIDIIDF